MRVQHNHTDGPAPSRFAPNVLLEPLDDLQRLPSQV